MTLYNVPAVAELGHLTSGGCTNCEVLASSMKRRMSSLSISLEHAALLQWCILAIWAVGHASCAGVRKKTKRSGIQSYHPYGIGKTLQESAPPR